MSELNPYEKFLDGRPVEVILATTPKALTAVMDAIGAEKSVIAPTPGKWSAAEILSHLADCELVFGFRLRPTLAEDGPVIQPFDQDKWAVTYKGIPAGPEASGRTVTHPERGTMTFQTIVETIAGHDLNHLGQLERITAQGE